MSLSHAAKSKTEPEPSTLNTALKKGPISTRPTTLAGTPNEQSAKLHPKEHGAYAMLAIPILTAFITTGPTPIGMCIGLAAITGFLAHEPLLLVWGHRGRRAQGNAPAAKTRLLTLLSITMLAGSMAFYFGTFAVRWGLILCAALASTTFAVAVAGKHRTLPGQLWGVSGLSLPCVPILLAGGLNASAALAVWTIWLIGFGATTLAVRSVIASQKHQSRAIHTIVLVAFSLLVASGTFASHYWQLASLPMILLSWYLLLAPPAAKHLRRVGWTLVAGTVLTALLVIWIF